MQITINDVTYYLNFGIGFIREMDQRFYQMVNGVRYGVAMDMKFPALVVGEMVALSDVLYSGTHVAEQRPKLNEVDDYVENHEDLESVFAEVIEELKKSNATKAKMKMYAVSDAEIKKAAEELEKKKKKPQKKPTNAS